MKAPLSETSQLSLYRFPAFRVTKTCQELETENPSQKGRNQTTNRKDVNMVKMKNNLTKS